MTTSEFVTQGNSKPVAERRAVASAPRDWPGSARQISCATLFLADVLALSVALWIANILRISIFLDVPAMHWGYWYASGAWLLARASSGLFSPCSLYPPVELQRSFDSSAVALLIHAAILATAGELHPSRALMLVVWPLALPFTYTLRTFFRARLIAFGRYGVPVVVVGNGMGARRALRELLARPESGYVPVAVFSSEVAAEGERLQMLGVPVVGRFEDALLDYKFPYRVDHVLLAIGSGWADERNRELAGRLALRYPSLQIFTNLSGEGHWLSQAKALGPYLTIQTNYHRFKPHQRLLKRLVDIGVALPALLVSSPFILLAGIAIFIIDPGPIFFAQVREGRTGKPIRIFKIRSMVKNAESQLSRYLAENPIARLEYEQTLKLRKDPRILPVVGEAIRRSSVDELPQLWNILKGDMSLVGPRVMPSREVDLYSEHGREMRRDVPPGLTGFWQVEHRNNSDFRVRETADSFYVSNWSIWLDLWILLRTVRSVLTGSGAT